MIKLSLDYLLIAMLFVMFFYCMIIDRRLRAFKSQEGKLKAVVDELALATENARDAIGELRISLDEMQRSHSDHVEAARSVQARLSQKIEFAEALIGRVDQGRGLSIQSEPRKAVSEDRSRLLTSERKEGLPSLQDLARSLRSRTGTGLR
jgi:hypothetical protein